MNTIFIKDNTFQVVSIVRAKENPDFELLIMSYFHRAYFCAVLGDPGHKHTAYFEKELIAPSKGQPLSFTRLAQKLSGIIKPKFNPSSR